MAAPPVGSPHGFGLDGPILVRWREDGSPYMEIWVDFIIIGDCRPLRLPLIRQFEALLRIRRGEAVPAINDVYTDRESTRKWWRDSQHKIYDQSLSCRARVYIKENGQ